MRHGAGCNYCWSTFYCSATSLPGITVSVVSHPLNFSPRRCIHYDWCFNAAWKGWRKHGDGSKTTPCTTSSLYATAPSPKKSSRWLFSQGGAITPKFPTPLGQFKTGGGASGPQRYAVEKPRPLLYNHCFGVSCSGEGGTPLSG